MSHEEHDLTDNLAGVRRAWEDIKVDLAKLGVLQKAKIEECDSLRALLAETRLELDRERALRRGLEATLYYTNERRCAVARSRGLTLGAAVLARRLNDQGVVRGRIVGWDASGQPILECAAPGLRSPSTWSASQVELDLPTGTKQED